MKPKYWIKLHFAILRDPKMGLLPDREWRRAIELMLFAGEKHCGGILPDEEELAHRLAITMVGLRHDLAMLERAGVIHQSDHRWVVTKFAEQQAPSARALLKKKRQSWYRDYLKTERWQQLRTRLIKDRGECCEWCENVEDLQVHHLSYDNLGAEPDEDLMVLCSDCHHNIHNMAGEDDADLAQTTR